MKSNPVEVFISDGTSLDHLPSRLSFAETTTSGIFTRKPIFGEPEHIRYKYYIVYGDDIDYWKLAGAKALCANDIPTSIIEYGEITLARLDYFKRFYRGKVTSNSLRSQCLEIFVKEECFCDLILWFENYSNVILPPIIESMLEYMFIDGEFDTRNTREKIETILTYNNPLNVQKKLEGILNDYC